MLLNHKAAKRTDRPRNEGLGELEGWLKGYTESYSGIAPAERLSPVAAAHRIYTNSLAAMPWMVRRKQGDTRDEADHYLERIIKTRANPWMSAFVARKVMLSQAFWYGTGYLYIDRDPRTAEIVGLIPLPSDTAVRSVDNQTQTVWYSFTVQQDDPEREKLSRKFQESELLIHRFETYDGRSGRGFLELAKNVISTDSSAQRYQEKFFRQGSRPSGVIQTDAQLNPETARIIRDDFERMASGMDNAFRIAVLDNGLKYNQLGISQADAQYIEGRAFTVDEVSRITGIPSYMMQAGKQSYSSNEQQQLDFVTSTLTAPVVSMEQEWTYKLLTERERAEGYYLRLNIMAMLRGDNESRSRYYEKMIGLGIYSQDDCRALEDRSPLPGGLGKNYWMSKNYDKIENFGGAEN